MMKMNEQRKFNGEVIELCEACGKPTIIQMPPFGAVACACDCVKLEHEKKRKRMAERENALRMEGLRKTGFPDRELSKCTFDMDDGGNPTLSEICKRYVDNFDKVYAEGKGLLMYGCVGGGKSFMAACIANALMNRGYSCLMTNFSRIANELSATFDGKQEYINNLNQFSLLIIDDLASERDTEYMGEVVQEVIDSRYRSRKPLIVTTNLTGKELNSPESIRRERIISRLFEMCFPVKVEYHDRRRHALKNNMEKRIEMIGN